MKNNKVKKFKPGKVISLDEVRKIVFTPEQLKRIRKEYPKFLEEMRKEVIREEMAKKIKQLRKKQKVTQEELAKSLKTSRTNIVSLESGQRNITLKTLDKIAKAMGKELVIDFK